MRTATKPNKPLTAEGRELRLKARPSARFNSLRSSKNREIHPHECALRHFLLTRIDPFIALRQFRTLRKSAYGKKQRAIQ
jgi:hypothetical protein